MDERRSYDQTRAAKFDGLNALLCFVRNDSGNDVNASSVLGISGVVNSPTANLKRFKSALIFTGVTPLTASHSGKFVVTQKAIKKGNVGLAYVAGLCPVQVSVGSTSDRFADVNNSDVTQLKSGSSGSAQILFAPSSTGTQWCWVRLENGC